MNIANILIFVLIHNPPFLKRMSFFVIYKIIINIKTNQMYGTKNIYLYFSLLGVTKDIYWIKFESLKPVGLICPAQISISSYGCIYQYYFVSLTCFWLCICCVYRYPYYISLLLLLWPVNIYFIPWHWVLLVIIIIVCLKYILTNYIYICTSRRWTYYINVSLLHCYSLWLY
jgi:hypothetical protein